MKIERNAFRSDDTVVPVLLGDSCLGCDDCVGLCRQMREFLELPQAVLSKSENKV